MRTARSQRAHAAKRRRQDRIFAFDRYVDASVIIKVVVADPKGDIESENGIRLREIRRHYRGGVVDTKASPSRLLPGRWLGAEAKPVIWTVSEDQEAIILHPDSQPRGQLVHGSEGAGKTTALVIWHFLRWIENFGERREGLQTAPTLDRLGNVQREFTKLWRPNWMRYVQRDDFRGYELCDGSRIRFVSTYRQSKTQGSPIQGFNSSWAGRDEMQDQVEVHADIQSRGRAAKFGGTYYKQLATATAKDDSAYRDLRDTLVSSGQWVKRQLSIFRSPYIAPGFLDSVKPTISIREFLRRYGDPKTGELPDLPPELAVYYGWLRTRNLVALPQIAKDVTEAILAGYSSYLYRGRPFGLLCSHDPGVIYNTTTVKRLLMFGSRPTWAAVGELQTKQTTARQHGGALRDYLRDTFGCHHPRMNGPLPIVFCDPHGKGEAQTDYNSVYGAFQKEGLDVFSPAAMSGRIQRKARVEMMNRLLEQERLVVAADEQGRPCAPKLVEAFESLQKREGDDDPEGSQTKNVSDKTHAPAATAYGLWMFEQEALTESTVKAAMKAAGMK